MENNYLLKGEEIPETIEYQNKSLVQVLIDKILQFPQDKISCIDAVTKELITYHELLNKAIKISKEFKLLGMTKGSVVLILLENNINYSAYVLGSLISQTVLCPCNPGYTSYELEHICAVIKPKLIITSSTSLKIVEKIQSKFNYNILEFSNCNEFDKNINSKEIYKMISNQQQQPEDPVFIICSSGTTGLAKGVVHTNSSMVQALYILGEKQMNANKEDVILAYLPFFHMMGIATLLGNLFWEQKLIVLTKFKPQTFLSALEEYKVNKMYIVPTVGLFLSEYSEIDNYDLSNLKEVICAGSKLDKSIFQKLTKRFNINLRIGYGMSEINYTTITPLGNKYITSIGRLLPGYEGKIIDPGTNASLRSYQAGELLIKSKCIFLEYFNNKKETLSTITHDGFVHTGDIVYYDNDGFIYVIDRLKDLIKHKSFQVSPTELEAILMKHEKVQDVAVLGIPDDKCGELPRAYVVLKQEKENCKENYELVEELKDFVAGHVSAYKRLSGGVRFVEQIPKNPSGKILRRLLKEKDDLVTNEKEL